jgi:tetratricopeptide (TPR) repeat protein
VTSAFFWRRSHVLAVAALIIFPAMSAAIDIESFWEYGDPAASETRFRAALGQAMPDERLELMTQIARTHSLRRQFDAAHAVLDEVEPQLGSAGPAPRARYFLERGRTFNSAGDKRRAAELFLEAWTTATAAQLEGLAVDAAHMLAIVEPPASAAQWTKRGVELARASADPKARGLLPALLNNHAWNLFEERKYEEALAAFREAETAWHATGRQPQGRIATWSVARALRALQRHEEALRLQTGLERQWNAAGGADGYVFEEIAENLEALGRTAEATAYFRRAEQELGKDPQFARAEAARWQRITSLAARAL